MPGWYTWNLHVDFRPEGNNFDDTFAHEINNGHLYDVFRFDFLTLGTAGKKNLDSTLTLGQIQFRSTANTRSTFPERCRSIFPETAADIIRLSAGSLTEP